MQVEELLDWKRLTATGPDVDPAFRSLWLSQHKKWQCRVCDFVSAHQAAAVRSDTASGDERVKKDSSPVDLHWQSLASYTGARDGCEL